LAIFATRDVSRWRDPNVANSESIFASELGIALSDIFGSGLFSDVENQNLVDRNSTSATGRRA
jgi:cobalamin biosynthesis protein CobD/CbiB